MPRPQEIEWMEARPFRAMSRVAAMALVAVAVALTVVELQHATPVPSVAWATARAR